MLYVGLQMQKKKNAVREENSWRTFRCASMAGRKNDASQCRLTTAGRSALLRFGFDSGHIEIVQQVLEEMRIQSDESDGIPERSFFLGGTEGP